MGRTPRRRTGCLPRRRGRRLQCLQRSSVGSQARLLPLCSPRAARAQSRRPLRCTLLAAAPQRSPPASRAPALAPAPIHARVRPPRLSAPGPQLPAPNSGTRLTNLPLPSSNDPGRRPRQRAAPADRHARGAGDAVCGAVPAHRRPHQQLHQQRCAAGGRAVPSESPGTIDERTRRLACRAARPRHACAEVCSCCKCRRAHIKAHAQTEEQRHRYADTQMHSHTPPSPGLNHIYVLSQYNVTSLNRHVARAYAFVNGVPRP